MSFILPLLRELYEADTARARRFRYGLLGFDALTILYVIATSFFPHEPWVERVDTLFGLVIAADLAARLAVSRKRMTFLASPLTLAELAALVSFLLPLAGEGFGFLRVLRTLRFLHSYELLARLRKVSPTLRSNQEVLTAATNLAVFLFVMTGLIYVTQHRTNPDIGNYADALYFTVTCLTTTGFGDITLPGTGGRLLSVAVMIVGVTLFLRLAQVTFRPTKVREPCPRCGLILHDIDAIHCKHCGKRLQIKTEGVY
ncbi:ion transporter [Pseudoroseicyclus aestuarii]|uniref:Voltage-gated potassium channel n=1 Tax=Pseudoroseicyclus aestuarii TaxID=1795041 RepID=A0A318SV87_9RHOB|nr:ion transporter [Pseudoroseicyclus aestuarii]PYE85760.1 voltage-gated potassium channel [Pseudoroseicyclus aestuarii]